jgi:outer membrane receptor protein involved in Fe transport
MLKQLLQPCCTLASIVLFASAVMAQSTGAIQGTVLDPSGAAIPNASITVQNQGTGEARSTTTDSAGLYAVAALPAGTYRVEVKAPGMAPTVASNVVLPVSSTVRQDFSLKLAATGETVEVQAAAPLVDSTTTSSGATINQTTVQEIPLNGRHFVDLALLIPTTVTPPQNGFLTAPLRGQGSFAFNTAGQREDSINFMINGINVSDPIQNQITFQPTINTVQEVKIDNFTFGAEYGRNSGSIVNIATRSGTNQWHGEGYEFLRNDFLDARNFTNPVGVLMAPFKRNQFGADGGGPIRRDKTFFYLSYEGLRQRQSVPLSTTVLSDAQRAQALASSDPIVQKLIPLIPAANSPGNVFVSSAVAPVSIDQGTADVSHSFSDANRFNFYYVFQRDNRNEPPTTQGNNLPGFGDQRAGHRQILTLSESTVISPTLVNEARAGYNRIYITFAAANTFNAADYGMNTGVNAPIGLPQISVTGAFAFGGLSGFPQGRGDNTVTLSDTLSWVHGKHTIKFGGNLYRINSDNFSYTPGTFTFPSISAFLADQANAFTANAGNGSNRSYSTSLGAFATDTWKVSSTLTLNLGLRWDWYGTPTEAENRYIVFDPTTVSLLPVGRSGGPALAYNQNDKNFEPRVGLVWDPFQKGRTVVRASYAIMTDQPIIGLTTPLAANPPYAFPVSFSPTASVPYVSFSNAYALAGGSVAPGSVAHNYKDAYVSEWNFNVQQQLGNNYALSVGYMGSKGTDLNIGRNYNQFINGLRPFPVLSASSPIDPGKPLANITVYESDGNSSYNALTATFTRQFAKGLQFNTNYTFAKSIDYNSRNHQGVVVQDSYNLRNDRGLSDYDVRHRWVLSGVYDLPFHGNRFKEGWEFSLIEQVQTGNPINFHLSTTALTGLAGVRPDVTGPVVTGYSPATNRNATNVTYIQNPGVFVNQGATHFGNLGRNVVIGPGFSNLDFSMVKNTKINERFTWQIRADAFDLLNQANWGQPGSVVGTATFGLITSTRFPPGDSGSSRQLQLAMKVIF